MVIIIAIVVVILILKFAVKYDKKHDTGTSAEYSQSVPEKHEVSTDVDLSPYESDSRWNDAQYTYLILVKGVHAKLTLAFENRDYTPTYDMARQYMYLIMTGTEIFADVMVNGVVGALRDYLQRDCWKHVRKGISWKEFIDGYIEFHSRAVASGLDIEKLPTLDEAEAAFRRELRYINEKFLDADNSEFGEIVEEQVNELVDLFVVKPGKIAEGEGIITPNLMKGFVLSKSM